MNHRNGRLADTKIAILATNGFEQSELEVPLQRLRAEGATVEVVSPESGSIVGWEKKDWGREVPVDRTIDKAEPHDYAALVLPGGQINPDVLRAEPKVIQFIREFATMNKPIAAICHGPWLLIEADLLRGREVTSYASIRTDVVNAGGNWVDQEVVVDGNLITSRKPEDLEAFCEALVAELDKKNLAAE